MGSRHKQKEIPLRGDSPRTGIFRQRLRSLHAAFSYEKNNGAKNQNTAEDIENGSTDTTGRGKLGTGIIYDIESKEMIGAGRQTGFTILHSPSAAIQSCISRNCDRNGRF